MTRRVVILEPDLDGHHAFWLSLLIEAHRRAGAQVEVIAPSDVSRLHAQSGLRGFDLSCARLHVAARGDDEGLLAQARQLARETDANRIFVPFLDRFWPAILKEPEEPGAIKLCGIWFHPHALDAKWRYAPPLDRRWRERGGLHRFLRGGGAARALDGVCFLAREPLKRWCSLAPGVPATLLPDPCENVPRMSRPEARAHLGIPGDRTVFLHLGSSEPRKGLPDLLGAFESLGTGGVRPLLLRVGTNERLPRDANERLARLVAAGAARVVNEFVPSESLMNYFAACDWVVVPYRKFRYSSGVLANAVGARRPVIAADYGEVGVRVAAEGLGLLYRHGSVAGLRAALSRASAGSADLFVNGMGRGVFAEDFLVALAPWLAEAPCGGPAVSAGGESRGGRP